MRTIKLHRQLLVGNVHYDKGTIVEVSDKRAKAMVKDRFADFWGGTPVNKVTNRDDVKAIKPMPRIVVDEKTGLPTVLHPPQPSMPGVATDALSGFPIEGDPAPEGKFSVSEAPAEAPAPATAPVAATAPVSAKPVGKPANSAPATKPVELAKPVETEKPAS